MNPQFRQQQEQIRKQQEELRRRQEMAVFYEQQKARKMQLPKQNLQSSPPSSYSRYSSIPSTEPEVHPFRAFFSFIWNLILTAVIDGIAVFIIAAVTNNNEALEVFSLGVIGLVGLIISIRRAKRAWNGE